MITNGIIKQRLSDELNNIFDQFMQETVDSIKLNLMPSIDKVPELININYLKTLDAFEIYLSNIHNKYNQIKGIEYLNDDKGQFIIRIKDFSKLDTELYKENLISAIKNEMDCLSEAINKEQIIDNYIVNKRVLIFLKLIIEKYYIELRKIFIKNASGSY